MEKIQKAIAKARADRNEPGHIAQPQTSAEASSSRTAQDVAAAWAGLTPMSPNPETLQKARVLTMKGSAEAAAFDVMRTKTLQTMRANNWRRLAITSATPACGKSTIALNLAFSLSRQNDVRTIVGELDLRRPSLANTLGVRPDRSIADVLRGKVDFASQALCYRKNLAFGLSTSTVGQAAELFQSSEVPGLLAGIEAQFDPDLMIFDMPPMLVNDDMMAFAGHVDCVLLVAAAEATTIKEIDSCERELASQTNVMGVVLNKCRYMEGAHGYGYYK